ncbi:MAG: hypothetical protein AB1529_02500 [Candidatus Micrarchaeota archaeon]
MESVFILTSEKLLRELVESSRAPCIIGDCAFFGGYSLPKGASFHDFRDKAEHMRFCEGSMEGDKIRRFELLVISQSGRCPMIVMANMEGLFIERREEFIRMVHAISRRKAAGCRLYLHVNEEMLRELSFFADRILR